ncbi:hypothetical protein EJD97_006176 [Solanum chilense]|uniref:DUF4219 domain-containing protein n=1 Tax=Solanum chilense TaxID=4083 RepID=A0A6N2CIS0_SOLCI|nr:hypothetical protein EJD97_006176 [Solanum chilense]
MAAPPVYQEGASLTRPPFFNGKYYGWWKNRMMEFIIAENYDLWDVVMDGPTIPTKFGADGTFGPKGRLELTPEDKIALQNNAKAKNILICGLGPDEYNRISSCSNAKEIWDTLQSAHERHMSPIKKCIVDYWKRKYELFRMTDGETIQEMHSRFTSIIDKMDSLGESLPSGKAVRKFFSVLPSSWVSKVEARDLDFEEENIKLITRTFRKC